MESFHFSLQKKKADSDEDDFKGFDMDDIIPPTPSPFISPYRKRRLTAMMIWKISSHPNQV